LTKLCKEYFQFLNRLYDITWFGTAYAKLTVKWFIKSVNFYKPGYESISCSNIENIPYN
jgi:hypothetical protein